MRSLGLDDRDPPNAPTGTGVVLSPADISRWGPVPRRQMADQVAEELSEPLEWDKREWDVHTFGDIDAPPRTHGSLLP